MEFRCESRSSNQLQARRAVTTLRDVPGATEQSQPAMTPNESPIIQTRTCSHPSRRHLGPPPMLPGPPLWLGIVVSTVLIVGETALVRVLASVASHNIFGMVYLLAVLVISAGWDIRLAVLTTFVSAAVYLESHLDADSGWLPASPAELVPLAIFLPIGLLTNALAGR